MTTASRLSFAQIADALRAVWLGKRHHVEICRQPKAFIEKRPAEWFVEQEARLAAVEQAGVEIAFISKHEASYLAWRAGVMGRAA